MDDPLERLVELVRRELGAEGARVVPSAPEGSAEGLELRRRLPDGRWLLVDAPRASGERAPEERLDALLECFAHTLEAAAATKPEVRRPSIPQALREELVDLRDRALATDALVIDSRTPVTWCSAGAGPAVDAAGRPLRVEARRSAERLRGLRLVAAGEPPPEEDDDDADVPEATLRAISSLRELPELGSLARGHRLRRTLREEGLGVLARSIGDIYVLALVFSDAAFDELRAARATALAAPRVERLLAALPPLDPTPDRPARAASLRRRGG